MSEVREYTLRMLVAPWSAVGLPRTHHGNVSVVRSSFGTNARIHVKRDGPSFYFSAGYWRQLTAFFFMAC